MVQVGIRELRCYGNQLLLKRHPSAVADIRSLSSQLYEVDMTAYGFLKEWNKWGSLPRLRVMDAFSLSVDLKYRSCGDDELVKRRFRNMWNSLWRGFCLDTGLQCTQLLADTGLKAAISTECDGMDVMDF